MADKEKARYWTAVLYPENMIDNWQDEIGDILQLPYAYCTHDKDIDAEGNQMKTHVHLLYCFNNSTTYRNALNVVKGLEKPGQTAVNKIERVINIKHMYNYLIHDTEDCRKKKKHLYSPEERITGNGFDIGAFEQLGTAEKGSMARELCDIALNEGFTNFADFYAYVVEHKPAEYFSVMASFGFIIERIIKGNWQRMVSEQQFWKK